MPWLLEELRMSQFAQAIGSKGQVSSRKIRRILDEALDRGFEMSLSAR